MPAVPPETAWRVTVYCKACRTRFQYKGRLADEPPCPACGHRPDPAAGAAADAVVAARLADPDLTAELARVRAALGRGEDPYPDD